MIAVTMKIAGLGGGGAGFYHGNLSHCISVASSFKNREIISRH